MADSRTLSREYIEDKRVRLTRLREELRAQATTAEAEEQIVREETLFRAREFEDDAQKLDALERDGNIVRRTVNRLSLIERALEKIEKGTYGISDLSGEQIPTERLDVVPEARTTQSEEQADEGTR